MNRFETEEERRERAARARRGRSNDEFYASGNEDREYESGRRQGDYEGRGGSDYRSSDYYRALEVGRNIGNRWDMGRDTGRGYEGRGGYEGRQSFEGRGGYEGRGNFEDRGGYEGGRNWRGPERYVWQSEPDWRSRNESQEWQGSRQSGYPQSSEQNWAMPSQYGSGYGYGESGNWQGNPAYSQINQQRRQAGSGSYYGSETGLQQRDQQGRFIGKGPRGYSRSDQRVQEDINERLTQDPDIDASEIEVKVQNGEVTLTGNVQDRHAKRMAEDCAEMVSGVKQVHNQIRVENQSESQQGTSQSNRKSQEHHEATVGKR